MRTIILGIGENQPRVTFDEVAAAFRAAPVALTEGREALIRELVVRLPVSGIRTVVKS